MKHRQAVVLFLALLLLVNLSMLFAAQRSGYRFETIEDFESGQVNLLSWLNEDISPTSWQLTTSDTYSGSAYSLMLTGNTWKQQLITPVVVDSGAVFQTAAKTSSGAKVQGIGFSDGTHVLFYSLSGTLVMNIEQWVPVYQGAQAAGEWFTYQFPIADDWYALFDYLPVITSLVYVNDLDGVNNRNFWIDAILDISSDIGVAPEVTVTNQITLQSNAENGSRNVGVQFFSTVLDPDSQSFTYAWSFGDSLTSADPNPYHVYTVTDNHPYRATLKVTDNTGKWGLASCLVNVDEGTDTLPIRMNFVGDVMLARAYEQAGGIIPTLGVNAIFEPTLDELGNAADLTIANLEVVLTDQGTMHPTKSVAYRGDPDNISGIVYAGIDLVSVANNHTLDWGLEGFTQMRGLLEQNGIIYSGSGNNSYDAYTPAFLNKNGLNIAFLASCDRTGQYNNAQPYLQSGYNKPGFAYMTPYYLLQQLAAVAGVADLKVVELHSGSEYSLGPGSNYDKSLIYADDTEDEEYDYRTDVPHLWDIAMRHFAIDSGADIVINHHSHIIQALEVYNGKLIVHSLGNFVFDLTYPETMPSMILYADADYDGFSNFLIKPVYIDAYIPDIATGQLGKYILDYLAMRSREQNTILLVDYNNVTATVPLDQGGISVSQHPYSFNQTLKPGTGQEKLTDPFKLPRYGSISRVDAIEPVSDAMYRVGSETVWFGNMEDEGSTLWDVPTFSTQYMVDGQRSAVLAPSNGQTVTATFKQRFKWYDNTKKYTLHGWIKTNNATNANILVRYFNTRTSGLLSSESLTLDISGTTDWTWFSKEITIPANAYYYAIRLTCSNSSGGTVQAWFDNVGLIEWTPWTAFIPMNSIPSPNNYYWMQVKTSENPKSLNVLFSERSYEAEPRRADSAKTLSTELKVFPNPLRSSATVSFDLTAKGKTTLSIYNLRGQKVRTLIDGNLPEGKHSITWDAKDSHGQRAGSGVYLLRLEQDGKSAVRKMVLMK